MNLTNLKMDNSHNCERKFKLHKLPVHLMTLLMWIPPACALKNRKLLKIILSYHLLMHVFWLINISVVSYAVLISQLYTIFPKTYMFLLLLYLVLLMCHDWYFLFTVFNQKKQLKLLETVHSINGDCVWPPKYTILLSVLSVLACVEASLVAFMEQQLWSGEFIEYAFSFLGNNFNVKIYSAFYVLFRVYQITGFFLYTPYLASLCLMVKGELNKCFITISSEEKLKTEKFGNELYKTTKLISLVNFQFEINNGIFLIVAVSSVMFWLYFGTVFRECYSYWIFAQIGCFASTLICFLWICATIHTKVRIITLPKSSCFVTKFVPSAAES